MSYVTGKTIRELREKRKFTQKELAERLNLSDKTISKWETGKGLPDIGVIDDLSKALGISVRFRKKGHGHIYAYCNRHGMFERRV